MPDAAKPAAGQDDIRLGDVVRTRKAHPCGGDTWTVIRTGADIKLRCQTCGHIVMLDRAVFLKRRKATLSRVDDADQKGEIANE